MSRTAYVLLGFAAFCLIGTAEAHGRLAASASFTDGGPIQTHLTDGGPIQTHVTDGGPIQTH